MSSLISLLIQQFQIIHFPCLLCTHLIVHLEVGDPRWRDLPGPDPRGMRTLLDLGEPGLDGHGDGAIVTVSQHRHLGRAACHQVDTAPSPPLAGVCHFGLKWKYPIQCKYLK